MSEQNILPCKECGASLSYAPGSGTLKCEFCGTENEIEGAGEATAGMGEKTGGKSSGGESSKIREIDYLAALANPEAEEETEEVTTIKCPGCSAEVGLDAGTLADECPFCATPLAREQSRASKHPKAQAVLPFAFDERGARGKMKDWLGGLWFAPSQLKKYAEAGRPLSGIYLPHYTYDAICDADYHGKRGDAYYVTKTRTVTVDGKSRQEEYQERKIRWTSVSGHVRHVFDDVLVQASDTMGKQGKTAEYGGRSWDLAALEPYRTEFLAGFRAEAPSVGIEEGYSRAQVVMKSTLESDVRTDIGGDEQRVTSMDDRYSDITFKHVLLPVWLASYRWNNKPFRVVVNGRTGKVSGERPYSAIKIAIAVAIGVAVVAGLAYAFLM